MTYINFSQITLHDFFLSDSDLLYLFNKTDDTGNCFIIKRSNSLLFYNFQGALLSKISFPTNYFYLGTLSSGECLFGVTDKFMARSSIQCFNPSTFSFTSLLKLADFSFDILSDYTFYPLCKNISNLSFNYDAQLHGSILNYFKLWEIYIQNNALNSACLLDEFTVSACSHFSSLFPNLFIYDSCLLGDFLFISATNNPLFFPTNKASSYVFRVDQYLGVRLLLGHDVVDNAQNIYSSYCHDLLEPPLWPIFCSTFIDISPNSFKIHTINLTHSCLISVDPLSLSCNILEAWSHTSELGVSPIVLSYVNYSSQILYRSVSNPLSFFVLDLEDYNFSY